MQTAIDMNSDVGESFGNYAFGADEAIIPHLSSANVACGFHGGDPVHMARTLTLARDHGVTVGVHWGLPDLGGFGRRRMDITAEEARCLTLYQIAALKGVATALGATVDHLVPHGALYSMLADEDDTVAGAMVEAIAMSDPSLVLYWPTPLQRHRFYALAAEAGIRVVPEMCVDMGYRRDGSLVLDRAVKAQEPEQLADRVQRLLEDGRLTTVEGDDIAFEVKALLLHSDGPNAAATAQAIRSRLQHMGIALTPAAQLI